MPYYQDGCVVEFKTSPHWLVFVGEERDDMLCYCIGRSGKEGAIVEYWDGCEKLSCEELDLACDVRVAEIKIGDESRITLKSKSGSKLGSFSPFFYISRP